MNSLDSDRYIGSIPQEKLSAYTTFMTNQSDKLHSKDAFKCKMPKVFCYKRHKCNHGYDGMYAAVVDSMNYLVGVRAAVEVVQKQHKLKYIINSTILWHLPTHGDVIPDEVGSIGFHINVIEIPK